jgi:putative oxidoreductase
MTLLRNIALLIGRILIVGLFLYEGVGFIRDYNGGLQYVTSIGTPAPQVVFPLILLLFLLGAILIVLGILTWLPALGFAAFCVITAVKVHLPNLAADYNALIQFGKDMGLAGGFLMLFAAGPGAIAFRRSRWSSRY